MLQIKSLAPMTSFIPAQKLWNQFRIQHHGIVVNPRDETQTNQLVHFFLLDVWNGNLQRWSEVFAFLLTFLRIIFTFFAFKNCSFHDVGAKQLLTITFGMNFEKCGHVKTLSQMWVAQVGVTPTTEKCGFMDMPTSLQLWCHHF